MQLKISHGEASRISTEITPLDEGTLYITHEGSMYADLNGQRIQIGAGTDVSQQQIINIIYPVGSIYMSVNSTNPSTLFGFGEWEQIQDTFLLAAGDKYVAGETGGEEEVTLTVDQIPAHTHGSSVAESGAHTHTLNTDKDVSYNSNGACWSVHNASTGAEYSNGSTSLSGNHSHTVTIDNTGGGQSHNNMPPYLSVYVWKRIS